MRFSRRRLLTNSKGDSQVAPTLIKAQPSTASVAKVGKPTDANYVSQANMLAERSSRRRLLQRPGNANTAGKPAGAVTLETANDLNVDSISGMGANTFVSDVATRVYMAPVLDEFLPNADRDPYTPPTYLYNIYRDIYHFDSISGGSIDMMASLAFSDFSLVGLEEKQMRPFRQSIDNMHIRRLIGQLSTEFLVHGFYVAQMLWDDDKKVYKNIIPHNPSYTYVKPHPIFGHDPMVSVDFAGAMREIGGGSSRNRKQMKQEEIDGVDAKMLQQQRYPVPIDELIYMTRNGLHKDVRGVSYVKRVLPIWLLEKSLIRGTLDQAAKRQRGIPHLQVGDDDWVPTAEDMRMLAEMYSNADLDPVGAVFITRKGVDVSEIRRGDDFWKYPDIYDWASTAKMRALGINEAVLSGDASLNTIDAAMSVFIEQVRNHRDTITYEVFYERMFPRIAVENGIKLKKQQARNWRETAKLVDSDGKPLPPTDQPMVMSMFEGASSVADFDPTKHAFPRLSWHKRLRPEADSAYLDVMNTLTTAGLPIPLSMWAAAGGMDIDALLQAMNEDGKRRKAIQEWKKEFSPDDGEGGQSEEASVKRIGVLNRDYEELAELYGVVNRTSDGKRHPLSAKGRKYLEEKVIRQVAEAAAELARRQNAKDRQTGESQ